MRMKWPALISTSGQQHIQNTWLLEKQDHIHLYTLTHTASELLEGIERHANSVHRSHNNQVKPVS